MDRLMEKLAVAKAIMDKSDNIKRGDARNIQSIEPVGDFEIPSAKYNIPNEYMSESIALTQKSPKTPTIDAIKNSKLPEDIKRLMIENPINIPQQNNSVTLSDELVEKASRLMRKDGNPQVKSEPSKNNLTETKIDYKLIQKMIESSVNKALKDNGLLVESTEKSNESFSFRVGKHIFEGKVTKIKKIE